jgi:hypothetical protein
LGYFSAKALNQVRHGEFLGGVKGARRRKANGHNPWFWAGLVLSLAVCFSARANVYATDIQINGSLQAGVLVPGGALAISYILNDTATNVSLRIYAGPNVVKTFTSGDSGAGAMTNAGLNTVIWDGTNDSGSAAVPGVYHVSITAAAAGYDEWTNITDDGANFQVFFPTSITVNRNTNSPYYGRVFVGNGAQGSGMPNGLLKYNADGSPADEGEFDTSGYNWNGDFFHPPSPWKMDIGSDDRLYVDDWSGQGVVVSFDQVLSTNYLSVLRSDNYPYPEVSLSGLSVCGEGTNMQLFMADVNTTNEYSGNAPYSGVGILSWTFAAGGVLATNDPGTVDVTLTNGSDLTEAPYAVCVDFLGNIYTIQRETNGDSNNSVLCFPPPPAGGPPDTLAAWEIGGNSPALMENYGVAVDPTDTYLAVASRGFGPLGAGESFTNGGVSIFYADNGSLITNITQDVEGYTNQEFFDVAWDRVGNLYTIYGEHGFEFEGWRVYSPPGSNQATTVAVPFIQRHLRHPAIDRFAQLDCRGHQFQPRLRPNSDGGSRGHAGFLPRRGRPVSETREQCTDELTPIGRRFQ